MWFVKVFGFKFELLKVKEVKIGKIYEVNVEIKIDQLGEYLIFQNEIIDSEMLRVELILYLLDKFCVSDEFYYEFSMIENGFLRFYFIK